MIDLQTALDVLRLDEDQTDSKLIDQYLDALPMYIETVTGIDAETVAVSDDGLLETLEKFLVQLLYNPDGTDSARLQVVIDSLVTAIKARHIADTMGGDQ